MTLTRLPRHLLDRYRRWRLERGIPASERLTDPGFQSDEFMRRLSFVIPGWLDHRNLRLFDHCIRHLPSSAPVIEIGSFLGLSLTHITHLLRKHGRKNRVFSLDDWTCATDWDYASASGSEASVGPRTDAAQSSGRPDHRIAGSTVTLDDFTSYAATHFVETSRSFAETACPITSS